MAYAFSKCGFCHPDLLEVVGTAAGKLLQEAEEDRGEVRLWRRHAGLSLAQPASAARLAGTRAGTSAYWRRRGAVCLIAAVIALQACSRGCLCRRRAGHCQCAGRLQPRGMLRP